MDQDEINRAEWENPDNWSGPKWISVYFSKRDSRTLVPRQIRAMGGTLNLGKTVGLDSVWGIFLVYQLMRSVLWAGRAAMPTKGR